MLVAGASRNRLIVQLAGPAAPFAGAAVMYAAAAALVLPVAHHPGWRQGPVLLRVHTDTPKPPNTIPVWLYCSHHTTTWPW